MSPLTILIVSSKAVVTAGLERIIREEQDMLVLGVAMNCSEGLLKARLVAPDLVIIVISDNLRQCLRLCHDIRDRSRNTRVIVMSSDTSPELASRFLTSGACGYVVDTTYPSELVRIVRRVGEGEVVVSGIMARPSPNELPLPAFEMRLKTVLLEDLSPRELKVLRLLVYGISNKEIARSLSLTESTVKWHLGRIYAKLGVSGRSEAIIYALNMGFNRSA